MFCCFYMCLFVCLLVFLLVYLILKLWFWFQYFHIAHCKYQDQFKTIELELFMALIECSELTQLTSLACLVLIDGWYLLSAIYSKKEHLIFQGLSFCYFSVCGFDPQFTSVYTVYTVYMSSTLIINQVGWVG